MGVRRQTVRFGEGRSAPATPLTGRRRGCSTRLIPRDRRTAALWLASSGGARLDLRNGGNGTVWRDELRPAQAKQQAAPRLTEGERRQRLRGGQRWRSSGRSGSVRPVDLHATGG
jgi:hypothetical protein